MKFGFESFSPSPLSLDISKNLVKNNNTIIDYWY